MAGSVIVWRGMDGRIVVGANVRFGSKGRIGSFVVRGVVQDGRRDDRRDAWPRRRGVEDSDRPHRQRARVEAAALLCRRSAHCVRSCMKTGFVGAGPLLAESSDVGIGEDAAGRRGRKGSTADRGGGRGDGRGEGGVGGSGRRRGGCHGG